MIHDLTHPLATAMSGFPADPEVRIEWDDGPEPWRVIALHLGTHSGTHVDAPRHYLSNGQGLGAYPPDGFVRQGVLLDAGGHAENAALDLGVLAPHWVAIEPGAIIVLRTGWDRWWGGPRYERHPYVGEDPADALVAAGVGLVSIDALNVDSTADGGAAAHAGLPAADVLIVENLRGLDALVAGRPYVFAVVPLALGNLDGAPVRALAWAAGFGFGAGA